MEVKSLKEIDFILWQEGKYYVAQCLNIEVSSFGETVDEAIKNLKEAVELYLEGENIELPKIEKIMLGKEKINV
jgi:predicted RNase H-like HicB family nuclease